MKFNFTKLFVCMLICCFISVTAVQAQWAQLATTGGTQATYTTAAVAPNGMLHIFFNGNVTVDGVATTDKAQVRRWTGTEWEQVGNAGFSVGGVEWTSIAFSPQGVPYVAFKDKGTVDGVANRMRVARLNGNTWEFIYNSAAEGRYASLVFDNNGVLHLAFRDHANGSKAVVLRYTGTGSNWTAVGPETGISTAAVMFTSIAFDSNNTLFLTYSEGGVAVVQKLVGNEWERVGEASLAGIVVNNTDIAIGPNNMPYLLVRAGDAASTALARVFRWNGTAWESVGGTEGFGTTNTIDWMNIVVGNDNKPYVGFMEAGGRTGVYMLNETNTGWVYVGGDRATGSTNSTHTGFTMNKATGQLYVTHRAASAGNRDIFAWQFTPTTTSAAKEFDKKAGIEAYPNPTTSSFNIVAAGKFSYTVYNSAGQVMELGKGVGTGEVGGAYKAGLYFIKLQTEAGNQTLKLLKQ